MYENSYNEGHERKSAFASPFSGQIASGMVGSGWVGLNRIGSDLVETRVD